MMSQKDLIDLKEWDVLLILDACRYDVFEDIYEKHLSGKLRPVESEGSETRQWIKNTFSEKYDFITYVSANPYINSISNVQYGSQFDKVIDIWDDGWDENIETVHPSKVTEAAKKELNFDNKLICHYLQPHYPYLSLKMGSCDLRDKIMNSKKDIRKFKSFFGKGIIKIFGRKRGNLLIGFLKGEQVLSQFQNLLEKVGIFDLAAAYKENLSFALDSITELLKESNKKVVITSDHGECFGEDGLWGHPPIQIIKFLERFLGWK